MFEKVNPSHPDKVADRIAGAIVDLAYNKTNNDIFNTHVAVEVLLGHGYCFIVTESNAIDLDDCKAVKDIVYRIVGTKEIEIYFNAQPQDKLLSDNQIKHIRCGDNGIFKGVPINREEYLLTKLMQHLYLKHPSDGKAILDNKNKKLIICQSNIKDNKDLLKEIIQFKKRYFRRHDIEINPIGQWSGGINVDSGATNRKLGSDMARAVTGGGLHGKDISKADVAINIICHDYANTIKENVIATCAIGDRFIDFRCEKDNTFLGEFDYQLLAKRAFNIIQSIGGFEKFAEWGLVY